MISETDKQLASLIEALKNGGEQAASILTTQFPDVAHQLWVRYMVNSAVTTGAWFFATFVLLTVGFVVSKKADEDAKEFRFLFWGVSVVPTIAGLIESATLFTGWLAPKTVILDECVKLLHRL